MSQKHLREQKEQHERQRAQLAETLQGRIDMLEQQLDKLNMNQ